jgi:plastocyanin
VFGPVGGHVETGTQYLSSGTLTGPKALVFTVKFPTPGTYQYVCLIREGMGGVIVVT